MLKLIWFESSGKKNWLLTEKAFQIIQQNKMKHINKHQLKAEIELDATNNKNFNIYQFVKKYL